MRVLYCKLKVHARFCALVLTPSTVKMSSQMGRHVICYRRFGGTRYLYLKPRSIYYNFNFQRISTGYFTALSVVVLYDYSVECWWWFGKERVMDSSCYEPGICLKEQRETRKILRIAGVRSRILTANLLDRHRHRNRFSRRVFTLKMKETRLPKLS
jgi:hypothetical protein